MTEDDTYLALKRVPYREAFRRWREFGVRPINGNDIDEFWKSIGWNETDFWAEYDPSKIE